MSPDKLTIPLNTAMLNLKSHRLAEVERGLDLVHSTDWFGIVRKMESTTGSNVASNSDEAVVLDKW